MLLRYTLAYDRGNEEPFQGSPKGNYLERLHGCHHRLHLPCLRIRQFFQILPYPKVLTTNFCRCSFAWATSPQQHQHPQVYR